MTGLSQELAIGYTVLLSVIRIIRYFQSVFRIIGHSQA